MKIRHKVDVLWLAFDGFFLKDPLQQNEAEALFQFEDEIAEYFKKYLPEQHQVYGNGNISHLKHTTEKLFKSSDSKLRAEISELLIKISIAASFIPEEKQETTNQ